MKTLIDELRDYKFYDGDRSRADKVSVSEVSGSDVHQAYLNRKFPDLKKPSKISQATMGSIYDMGLRQIVDSIDGMENGKRTEYKLPNGVTLTGESDHFDHNNKQIIDGKLSKLFAMKSCQKENSHHYRLQLNWYRIIYGYEDYSMWLYWSLKDQSDVKADHPDEALVPVEVEPISERWLVDKAVEFSNELKQRLEHNQPKEKCDDTWRNDMRCKSYCDNAPACEYAKKKRYVGAGQW
jgi:hypothetical protein